MASRGADVRVVGVGGGGGNAVRHMAARGLEGVVLVAANTDTQALLHHPAELHVVLGTRTTRGLGAGGRPAAGLSAAQESIPQLVRALEGADLVFVAAGLGGGTGTGAAPLVANVARDLGALVVGVVTVPFAFEGARRNRLAQQGLAALRENVDSLIVIENDRLLELGDDEPTALEAFGRADAVLSDGVRGIGELVVRPGLVNLDFADVCAVLRGGGRAVMGLGVGYGPDRAARAVEAATRSPLLAQGSIEGARGVLVSFTVDASLGLGRIHEAAARVQAEVDDDAEIFFGVRVEPTLRDEAHVSIVAAGLPEPEESVTRSTELESVRPAPQAHDAPVLVGSASRRRNALVMLR